MYSIYISANANAGTQMHPYREILNPPKRGVTGNGMGDKMTIQMRRIHFK
jgi:hypothetical protein